MRISEEIDFMREELLELYLFEKETHRMCIIVLDRKELGYKSSNFDKLLVES
jgi:uncharacterized protein YqgQ